MGMAWDETPSYLRLGTDELEARAWQARALLGQERCGVCPRLRKVDRLADHKGLWIYSRLTVSPRDGKRHAPRTSLTG